MSKVSTIRLQLIRDLNIFVCCKNFIILTIFVWIFVKKVTEKSSWKNNLKIKSLVEKSQFSEFIGQNVIGSKILELFFLKWYGGLQKNSWRKYVRRKKEKEKSLGRIRSSLRRFHKKDFSSKHLHIQYSQGGVFDN